MERRISADGWRAMEAIDERKIFNFCRNQEGTNPITNDQWRINLSYIVDAAGHFLPLGLTINVKPSVDRPVEGM